METKTLAQEQQEIDNFHNNESFDLFETLAEILKPE